MQTAPLPLLPNLSRHALIPTPIFVDALKEHLEALDFHSTPASEKNICFYPCNAEDVVNALTKHIADYSRNSRLVRYAHRFRSIIEPFEQFFSAVDQVVSAHPQIVGVVWGCFRFIVLVCT